MPERYIRSKRTGTVKSQSELYGELISNNPEYSQSQEDLVSAYLNHPDYEEVRTLSGFGKNAVESASNFVKDTVSAIAGLNPLAGAPTVKGIADVVVGTVSKASGSGGQIERVAGGNPYVDQEAMASALAQHFQERYGGWDNIKQTMYEDPVGFASDVSSVLSLGGAAAKGASAVARAAGATKLGKGLSAASKGMAVASDFADPITAIPKTARMALAGQNSRLAKYAESKLYGPSLVPEGDTIEKVEDIIHKGVAKYGIPVSKDGKAIAEAIRDSKHSQATGLLGDASAKIPPTLADRYAIDPLDVMKVVDKQMVDLHPAGDASDWLRGMNRSKRQWLEKYGATFDKKGHMLSPPTLPITLDMIPNIKKATNKVIQQSQKAFNTGKINPASVDFNKFMAAGLNEAMADKFRSGPIPELADYGDRILALGKEERDLIKIRDAVDKSLRAEYGVPVMREAYATSQVGQSLMTGKATPLAGATVARWVFRSPEKASKTAIATRQRYGGPASVVKVGHAGRVPVPYPGLHAGNVLTTIERYNEEPPVRVEIESVDPFR